MAADSRTRSVTTTNGAKKYTDADGQVRLVKVSASYSVLSGERLIEVEDTSSARTITLPARDTVPAGEEITVKDGSGGAGTNAITIARSGSDTMDGATSLLIETNYGAVTLFASDDGWSIKDISGKLRRRVVLAAQATTVAFTGLRGNSVSGYGFRCRGINNLAADTAIFIRPNGVSTNQGAAAVEVDGGGAPGNNNDATGMRFGALRTAADRVTQSNGEIMTKTGAIRAGTAHTCENAGAALPRVGLWAFQWTETVTEVTELSFHAGAANAWKTGSEFEIWEL